MGDDVRIRRRTRGGAPLALVLAASVLGACTGDDGVRPQDEPSLREIALAAGLAPVPFEPVRPIDNPHVPARVELGHLLFFDPVLSGPKDVACSTCHLPRLAFGDGRQFPSGTGAHGLGPERTLPGPPPLREMPRNSPSMFNLGLFGRFGPEPSENAAIFWGANAFGIERQVLSPITADNELMGLTFDKAVARDSIIHRLRDLPEYVDRFAAAFPEVLASGPGTPERLVTTTTLRRALAAYLRELVTPRAPFDDFLRGDDDALSAEQRAGLAVFVGKGGCASCHTGPLLSDFTPHVLGTPQAGLGRDTTPGDDLGWGEMGGVPYAFRTPPLRQIAETAPYFHAGTYATLADVIEFKNRGESEYVRVPRSTLDPRVRPLGLSPAEMAQLVTFLGALTDTTTIKGALFHAPLAVPSGLTIPK